MKARFSKIREEFLNWLALPLAFPPILIRTLSQIGYAWRRERYYRGILAQDRLRRRATHERLKRHDRNVGTYYPPEIMHKEDWPRLYAEDEERIQKGLEPLFDWRD